MKKTKHFHDNLKQIILLTILNYIEINEYFKAII